MPVRILSDNAEMLASAFRSLSAAQKSSKTEVIQNGVTLVMESWKDGRIYRNSLRVSFRDEKHHDIYTVELRDLIAVAVVKDKFVVQTDTVELRFDVVDEIQPARCPCPPFPF